MLNRRIEMHTVIGTHYENNGFDFVRSFYAIERKEDDILAMGELRQDCS